MLVTLANGKPLRGDFVVSAVLRYDLAPIPCTFEGTFRVDDDLAPFLAEGQILTAGRDGAAFYLIKSAAGKQAPAVQGSRLMGAISVIGLLAPCHQVAFRRQTAVIKSNATLGGIYRACGAAVRIESDFPVANFACYAGDVPTFRIAQALQEESAALRWTGKALQALRLADLFKQKPVASFAADTAENLQSGFLERHEVPAFFSIGPDGGFVYGNRAKARNAQYLPRSDERVLRNATRALVYRKVLTTTQGFAVRAGDVIEMAKTPYAVVTAAHVHQGGTDGGGQNDYSRLWLASLEE
jgi:hypothetical protein